MRSHRPYGPVAYLCGLRYSGPYFFLAEPMDKTNGDNGGNGDQLPVPKPKQVIEPEVITPKMGRPTKYRNNFPDLVYNFLHRQKALRKLPTKAGLCVFLGVHKEALINYEKKYPDFSNATKRLMLEQENYLIQRMMDGDAPFVPCLFMLKNNHGYRDQMDFDHSMTTKRQIMIVNGEEIEF